MTFECANFLTATALKELWDAPKPHDVWEILEREAAARAEDIAIELRREAEAVAIVNPGSAERLGQIADEVEKVHDSVNVSAIQNLADLVALYRKYPICYSATFNRLLGSFLARCPARRKDQRVGKLRHAMKLLSNIYVAVFLIQRWGQDRTQRRRAETIPRTARSCATRASSEFLHGSTRAFRCGPRARVCGSLCKAGELHPLRVQTCPQAITKLKGRVESGTDGDAEFAFSIPISPDQAELWFLAGESYGATLSSRRR